MQKEINNFNDLEAWKKAHELALEIYKITKKFPREEMFGLTSQSRSAACSVSANIAEGFARFHYKDKTRFYYQARGSNAEAQSFLLLARDLSLISCNECPELFEKANESRKLINGLIKSIAKQI